MVMVLWEVGAVAAAALGVERRVDVRETFVRSRASADRAAAAVAIRPFD
jgi:hypothetical protein